MNLKLTHDPSNDDYVGTLVANGEKFDACVSTGPSGNHPPAGTYSLSKIETVPSKNMQYTNAYGWYMMFFKPISGAAKQKDAIKPFVLAIHGGGTDNDGKLYRSKFYILYD